MTTMKFAGLALMTGIILTIVTSLLLPGNTLIDPVDQTDFAAAVGAMADAPALTHAMAFLTIVATLLIAHGVYSLYPSAGRQGGFGGAVLQFGIIVSLLEWSIIIIATGMRQFTTHLTQRAAEANAADAAVFNAAALDVHTMMVAVLLGFLLLAPIGTLLVGIGLTTRMPEMSIFKLATAALSLSGIAGLVIVLLGLFTGAENALTYLQISTSLLFLSSVCLFIVGLGMYQGRADLTGEEAAAS